MRTTKTPPRRGRLEPHPLTDGEMEGVRERLRLARKNAGLSARTCADRLGGKGFPVEYSTILRYERGEMRPPADYVLAVAILTETSPGWLLTGEGSRQRR